MELFRDRDYFQDTQGDIYQVLGSLHFKEGIFALQKYKRVGENEINEMESRLAEQNNPLRGIKEHLFRIWIRKDSKEKFVRILPNYTSYSANDNIKESHYSKFCSIFKRQLIIVPRENISLHWSPTERLKDLFHKINSENFATKQSLDKLEREAIEVSLILHEYYAIPLNQIGITGSILWNSHHEQSDIDLMIYGHYNREKFYSSDQKITADSKGLRKYHKVEMYPLAQKLSIKSGMPIEDCFMNYYEKPYLFFFHQRKVSITFAPSLTELVRSPLYTPDSQFIDLGLCRMKAKIVSDEWGFDYPGLFEIEVESFFHLPANISLQKQDVTRLMIYEHEFVGYYQKGDEVEIQGLLQHARGVSQYRNPQNLMDTYQILVGGVETFGNEYVKKHSRVPEDELDEKKKN